MTADDVIVALDLKPLPIEGGYFRETYRSREQFGDRALATAIYYLLKPTTRSIMHRLKHDEVFHFYRGDPVEQLHLFGNGTGRVVTIGSDLAGGHRPQCVVPGGVWQGARLRPGGSWALLGTTMSPGFSFDDFEAGRRQELIGRWPHFADLIADLTPDS